MYESPLNNLHFLTKTYIFLFVILIAAFFGKLFVLILTTFIILIILVISKLPLKLVWNEIKIYAILFIPVVFLLSWLEHSIGKDMLVTAAITYLRFFNLFIIGAIYGLTTNPSDIVFFCFRYKHLRKFGIALSAAFNAIMVLDKKLRNTISLQQLRGIELNWNPFKMKKTFSGIQAVIVPIIMQTVELSQCFVDAMVARGYSAERKIDLPPYLKMKKKDFALILLFTLFLFLILR